MDTTPMTFKIEIPRNEWYNHPLRNEWRNNVPMYPHTTVNTFLKRYNINLINFLPLESAMVELKFQSEQDYILWKLHQ